MISYVLLRPDLPATFESLNDDSKRLILQFVGNKSYVTYAGINKHCKEIYLTTKGMTKKTFLYGYAPLSVIKKRYVNAPLNDGVPELMVGKGVVLYNRLDLLEWALQERKKYLLRRICAVAAGEGRIDLLDEVWDNDEYFERSIFYSVDGHAARGGKLEVLKWLETNGIYIIKEDCAETAAEGGQLHIIQWLKKEQDLQLTGYLVKYMYVEAIWGGHFHVMKWLREQSCYLGGLIFNNAAMKGNLDILQWLHDEGCPWPEDNYCVPERGLNPEVIDWCRVNGYSNRLY